MRSYKTVVVITLSKALWGKGVLRQVSKEVWLKGERGHIFLFRIIIKCNSVWGTISGATLQDLNLAYPLPAV